MGVRPVFRAKGAQANGTRAFEICSCQLEKRAANLLRGASIPPRYEHCSFENFVTDFPGADRSLAAAHLMAHRFVEGYPVTTEGKGLLFTGTAGVGKTHLAASILLALVKEKGVKGLFCEYRELLKEIGNSYNPRVAATELDVLRPVFRAEVLVLDELGATQPTSWIWDTVALIINKRYASKLTTIVTTNFPDLPGAGPEPTGFTDAEMAERSKRAAREQTLGDRIGETMRSRLAEMCVTIKIAGTDFRQGVGRARFG